MNASVHAQPRHFLDLLELSSGELRGILDSAEAIKAARVKGAEAAARYAESLGERIRNGEFSVELSRQ